MHFKSKKSLIVLVIIVAVALNTVTFAFAFQVTFKPDVPTLARDFSAYYNGEWRLFHNPSQVYTVVPLPGDYPITPRAQDFKYTPSFLILFAPFLALKYQDAFAAFDILQFALIPALAFCVYKLVKDKNVILGALAAVIVVIDPLPNPPFDGSALHLLGYRFTTFNPQSFSTSYYWGYALGNAHVLQAIMLVGALYFGYTKKPWLSALLFAFSVFDPRMALLALPLLLWYNKGAIRKFLVGATGFIVLTNLPFFFYYNLGASFFDAQLRGYVVYGMYPYDWIPTYGVAALSIVELVNVLANSKRFKMLFQNRRQKC